MSKSLTLSTFIIVLVANSSSAAPVFPQSDSVKMRWSENGHFYKRYDNSVITWNAAKSACEKVGAHLATITSATEQAFVQSLLSDAPQYTYYAIGASDAAIEGSWQWVTGEGKDGWVYRNWGSYEPDQNDTSQNYMYMYRAYSSTSSDYGKWYDAVDSLADSGGYICEWSSNNYIGSVMLPDQNGNAKPEDAILYVDFKTSKHTVVIRDRKSPNAQIGTALTFATEDRPPKGIAAIADTNGNAKPEIAVLDTNYGNSTPIVRIKDLSSNAVYLRSIYFLDYNYIAQSISAEPDSNGNGYSELTVMGTHKDTGKAYTQTRDSKTGALLYSNKF